jgi:cell division protein FtsL
MLAKIVQHNLSPIVRRSNLILKMAQFVYAICLGLPFCLCKHIMGVMIEARDENNTGLLFGCLLTQIIFQLGIDVAREPKMKIQDPLIKQTLMKSNTQLRHDDQDEAPQPPSIHFEMPDIASSSQTAPSSPQQDVVSIHILVALASLQGGTSSMHQAMSSMQQEVHSINLHVPNIASSSQTAPLSPQQDVVSTHILVALASLQGGMSSIQQAMSSMQQEVHSINLHVEQSQLDIQECLKYHRLSSSDDEDDAL